MSTTITAPAVELTELHLPHHDQRSHNTNNSTAVPIPVIVEAAQSTNRVFQAAPTVVSQRSRFLIISLVVVGNLIQFISNFVTLAGGLKFSRVLGREVGPGKANWMAAAYSLTQGAFVLITGRLGEIFGHQRMVLLGTALFALFSLINGFCTTYDSFVALRALTGIGGGIFMPNAVALITTMVPPGRTRNLTLGFFASAPPIGGVIGGLLVGVFLDMAPWVWLFVIIAALSALTGLGLFFLMPADIPVDRSGKIDYVGASLGLSGLLLFNVAWNEAPAVGWSAPHVIVLITVSVLTMAAFLAWEKWYAEGAIMPLHLFKVPTFSAVVFVVLLSYMGFGISLWYSISWQQLLRHTSVLQTGINFIPFGLGSVASVGIAAWMLPRIAAQWILALGIATVIVSNLLLATMPIKQIYWSQAFAATFISSFCPDFVFVAAQLIASNSVGRRHQGVASSLIGTLNLYGNSLGIGVGGTIETQVSHGEKPEDLVVGFRAALYFGAALAVAALALDFAFVRMPKDEREGWDDVEDQEAIVVHASATSVERQP